MKRLLVTAMLGVATALTTAPVFAQHAHHGPARGEKKLEAPTWTKYPVLIAASGFSREGASFQAFNMHGMQATSFASFAGQGRQDMEDASSILNIDENGKLSVKAGKQGGYYLVRVMGHGPAGEEAVATTLKYFSKPGPAPRELLNTARSGFEITPAVLPREHSRYRENETWPFRVSMDGQPFVGGSVSLQTSNGTSMEFITDPEGVAHVTLPKDFPDIPKEQWRHGRPPSSKFVLAVRDGALLATFNGDYSLYAYGDKNIWAGVGFAVFGMIVAVPLVRRRKSA